MARRGTGGDAAVIRQALQGHISPAAPPSFHQDLERLRTHSAETLRQLKRFTALPAPEGIVQLVRPVGARVVEAAGLGTLALTGEPGASKSAVLFALAHELQQHHPVVCLAVETGASTLDLLRVEIGLHHSLINVLWHLTSTNQKLIERGKRTPANASRGLLVLFIAVKAFFFY